MISLLVSRDNSVHIAMGYGMEGRGSIPGRGKTFSLFPAVFRTTLGPTQPLTQWVARALSPGGKAART
jgi:hypothetical protein